MNITNPASSSGGVIKAKREQEVEKWGVQSIFLAKNGNSSGNARYIGAFIQPLSATLAIADLTIQPFLDFS
ncbi:hypothetical protein [Paraburkholderia rhynchosiae]|uniref:hypothetical protein n=1 Tax=Paraburkholderia rhynchosiae TaxID=487049 RepID=UPI0011AEC50B|nr:hypothetical protein [Paraburkholderia rhynchosiae]